MKDKKEKSRTELLNEAIDFFIVNADPYIKNFIVPSKFDVIDINGVKLQTTDGEQTKIEIKNRLLQKIKNFVASYLSETNIPELMGIDFRKLDAKAMEMFTSFTTFLHGVALECTILGYILGSLPSYFEHKSEKNDTFINRFLNGELPESYYKFNKKKLTKLGLDEETIKKFMRAKSKFNRRKKKGGK